MKNILLDLQKSTTRPTASKKFKNILPTLKEKIYWSDKPAEIFHAIINDLESKPLCKFCGNEKTFYGIEKGYSNTCGSKSCAAKFSFEIHPELIESQKERMKNFKHSEESKRKMSKKAKIFNSNPEKIEKTRQSVKKKYGVDNVFQLDETKEKAKETCLEKYGVEFNSQRDEIKELNRNFMNDMLHKKEKEFGTKYLMQIPEYFEKAQKVKAKNKFKIKEFTFESGRVEIIQGYEDKAINKLLKTYDENDLILSETDKPKIIYDFENKTRRYYCDIWIPKDNLVIEVKSEYTMLVEFEKNIAKAVATKKAGYNYKLMVF
jgi:hypothetical protein